MTLTTLLDVVLPSLKKRPYEIKSETIMATTIEFEFEFEKETKNSVRYKEVPEAGKPPIVGCAKVVCWGYKEDEHYS